MKHLMIQKILLIINNIKLMKNKNMNSNLKFYNNWGIKFMIIKFCNNNLNLKIVLYNIINNLIIYKLMISNNN